MQSAEVVEERKQRKKLQNRLNQRARRSRVKDQESRSKTDDPRPYQVDRWRYAYSHSGDARVHATSDQINETLQVTESAAFTNKVQAPRPPHAHETNVTAWLGTADKLRSFKPSPTQDHMLHLIQINVLRGFFDNKLAILYNACYFTRNGEDEVLQAVAPEQVFPGRAAIMPITNDLPESLCPTLLQSTVVHATCIDLIPFPKMRDNLIKWDGHFSWAALLDDLVGRLVDPACFVCPRRQRNNQTTTEALPVSKDNDDLAANGNGIIVWGAPHCPESWEITNGFLRKWGWLLKGCDGIIESTNRWRRTRGEEDLRAFK